MKPSDLASQFNLKRRVAIMTGGLGMLGREFTKTLLQANARVAVFDIVDPSKSDIALAKKFPLKFFKIDVTNEREVGSAIRQIQQKWDTPTILVNNVGWKASPRDTGAGTPFQKYPMDLWEEVFKVNTLSAAVCSKIVGGAMIRRKKPGVIINIASLYALASPDQKIYDYKLKKTGRKFFKDPPYGASKAALIAFTRDLAVQWAPYGIRVVAMALGGVQREKSDKAFVKAYSSRTPLGRMARKDDFNGALVFLASDAASYITGTTLVIDGGWTA